MILVFLHGPPASGKLTVARQLARLTGFKLFHNHLVVDALLAVFEFGSRPFVALREEMWLAVFRAAARQDVSLIFTFAPERTVQPSFPSAAVAAVEQGGGRVVFVELTCPVEELEKRFGDASRAGFGKLDSAALFHRLAASGVFDHGPLPPPALTIDTSRSSAAEAAATIGEFLRSTERSPA